MHTSPLCVQTTLRRIIEDAAESSIYSAVAGGGVGGVQWLGE